MSTLQQLAEDGILVKLDVLEENELPQRCIYALPKFVLWLQNVLPTMAEDAMYSDATPLEQVTVMFEDYASGEAFSTDRRFRKLSCTPEHWVWELKTDSIRIFGWVPHKDFFICCFGDSADTIKQFNMYGTYIAQTVYERNNLQLDSPKYVEGKDYPHVISD